ncbi:hypothetical protein [Klebsiella pneumoniae]|uniref:hypothetical protein n=1 Tax=Klebsiella pneumoniae TaxID=573 RepID=UPI00130304F8|nr:hypothetical protein [Klebsiella pneumoniae]
MELRSVILRYKEEKNKMVIGGMKENGKMKIGKERRKEEKKEMEGMYKEGEEM